MPTSTLLEDAKRHVSVWADGGAKVEGFAKASGYVEAPVSAFRKTFVRAYKQQREATSLLKQFSESEPFGRLLCFLERSEPF